MRGVQVLEPAFADRDQGFEALSTALRCGAVVLETLIEDQKMHVQPASGLIWLPDLWNKKSTSMYD